MVGSRVAAVRIPISTIDFVERRDSLPAPTITDLLPPRSHDTFEDITRGSFVEIIVNLKKTGSKVDVHSPGLGPFRVVVITFLFFAQPLAFPLSPEDPLIVGLWFLIYLV